MASRTLTLRWATRATRNLEELNLYIAEQNPTAAAALIDRVFEAAEKLTVFPQLGRTGRVAGTRELILSGTSIIVAYQLDREYVEIVAVLHTARRWPHAFPKRPTLH